VIRDAVADAVLQACESEKPFTKALNCLRDSYGVERFEGLLTACAHYLS